MEEIELFEKLKSWIKVVHWITVAVDLLQAVVLVLIGVAFRNILNSENQEKISFWTNVVIIVIVVFVIISIIKLIYNLTFPASIVDELQSKMELKEVKRELGKKRNINQYVIESIASLNGQTCDLSNKIKIDLGKAKEEDFDPDYLQRIGKFCHKDIGQGMSKCLEPVISHTSDLLNTTEAKFTIGIYFDHYYKIPEKIGDQKLNYEDLNAKGTFILEDKNDLKSMLDHDFMADEDATDLKEIIQNQIRQTIKIQGEKFVARKINMNGGFFYSIITSGIPFVCIDHHEEANYKSRGVLFIIGPNVEIEDMPKDLNVTLNIFNKLATNWLDKHDECVANKFPKKSADV